MAKVKITQTNGATAEDISAAIGEFLANYEKEDANIDTIEEVEEK